MFRTFDRPDSSLSCPRRQVTTVAPQALWFLNHRVGLQQARKLAERLVTGHGDDPPAWVENAWRITLSRLPSEAEKREALDLLGALSPGGARGNGGNGGSGRTLVDRPGAGRGLDATVPDHIQFERVRIY